MDIQFPADAAFGAAQFPGAVRLAQADTGAPLTLSDGALAGSGPVLSEDALPPPAAQVPDLPPAGAETLVAPVQGSVAPSAPTPAQTVPAAADSGPSADATLSASAGGLPDPSAADPTALADPASAAFSLSDPLGLLADINTWLVTNFGELGPLFAVGFLGILLTLLTLPILMKREEDPLDRLKGQAVRGVRNAAPETEKKKKLRHAGNHASKLDKYASFLEPQDAEELSNARMTMIRAGYRSKSAVRTFHFAQFALGLGFLAIGALFAIVSSASGDVTTQQMVLYVMLPGGVGYYLPKYWVNKRVKERVQQITEGFPDALDMMLVCVEAGQSLEQSIIRVAKELQAGYPALAQEFESVAHEIKAGKEKIQVLKDMSERAGVADVSSFVTVLIQSATFGTSIAEALRVYAGEMRDKRVMRAEEKANVLPTKLTLGTMMFTVPPLLIILIGPSIYSIYTTLQGNAF